MAYIDKTHRLTKQVKIQLAPSTFDGLRQAAFELEIEHSPLCRKIVEAALQVDPEVFMELCEVAAALKITPGVLSTVIIEAALDARMEQRRLQLETKKIA